MESMGGGGGGDSTKQSWCQEWILYSCLAHKGFTKTDA